MEREKQYEALFLKAEELLSVKNRVVIAIDGGAASGKTTLADLLAKRYGGEIVHMDDFFLRPEQRRPERYAEVGGNIDRERFSEEVLLPLSKNEPIIYRKFDCSTMTLSEPIKVETKKLTIIEGAYSMHPVFCEHYDLSVFLDISPDLQKKRIEKRNSPEMAERFYNQWIPLEEIYFSQTQIKERCNISILIYE